MFICHNKVQVEGFPRFKPSGVFLLDKGAYALKLTLHVHENPIVLQITEDETQQFADADELDTQAELPLGFQSLPFITPITGFRIRRGAGGQPAHVDLRIYG